MGAVPEVRTLVERAASRRHALEGLIAAVPEAYWGLRAAGDQWTALDHVRHVATVDVVVVELAEAAGAPGEALWVGGARNAAALEERRAGLMEGVREQERGALIETMRRSREDAMRALLAAPVGALERGVRVAGSLTAWGEPRAFTLRSWLAAWAEHDGEHEAAIRRAIETPPDATALTLAARRARVRG